MKQNHFRIGRRLLALALCLGLLVGAAPMPALASGGWSVRWSESAYEGKTLRVGLLDGVRRVGIETEWTEGGGILTADRSGAQLLPEGDCYAVVQCITPPSEGGLTDAQIEAEFELLLEAVAGGQEQGDGPLPEDLDLPEGYPDETYEEAMRWYNEVAVSEPGLSNYVSAIGSYLAYFGEDEAVEIINELFVAEYLSLNGYSDPDDPYGMDYDPEELREYDISEKRTLIEYLMLVPWTAPAGYVPPAEGEENPAEVSVVLRKLTDAEKQNGLTVTDTFFSACVPLTVRTPTTSSYYGQSERAPFALYFREDGLTVPAGVAEKLPEDEEDASMDALFADLYGQGGGDLNGTYAAGTVLRVEPGAYLATLSSDVLDWETAEVTPNGGSIDFTSGREYVTFTAEAEGVGDSLLIEDLQLSVSGGVLGQASLDASFGENGLRIRPGEYGDAMFVVTEARSDGMAMTVFASMWELTGLGEVTEDRAFSRPRRARRASSRRWNSPLRPGAKRPSRPARSCAARSR